MRRRLARSAVILLVGLASLTGVVSGAGPAGAARHRGTVDGLVDVGGYRLYLRCTGHGSPTVVMDASLGGDSSTWSDVEPLLARYTRVCVYDRAGLGRSDPGPVPRTSQTVVDELQTLLRNAGIEGPYVLVGHSIGGLNMQLFAREDGGRTVLGVVLVDATPAQFADVVGNAGFPVPTPEENPEGFDIRGGSAEVLAAPPFPAIPLVVLTHGIAILPPPLEQPWQELQAAQAQLSPLGRLVVARGSGHFIQNDQPRLVLRSIIEVVAQARHSGRRAA